MYEHRSLNTWLTKVPSLQKRLHHTLLDQVQQLRSAQVIYPPTGFELHVLSLCAFEDVRVVILGQDPYHGVGEAHGLAFSVPEGIKTPPSLRNIFKELESDVGIQRTQTNLSDWARQGVLLLNSTLTVVENAPASHQHLGWQAITDDIVHSLSVHHAHLVFVLWGAHAQKKRALIDMQKHTVLQSAHPSPLSVYRGFWGSKPFSQANTALHQHGQTTIVW